MPRFEYRAVSSSGETLTGELEAATREQAIEHLQRGGLLPLRAEEVSADAVKSKNLSGLFRRRQSISRADISFFTRELATLLEAGLPLDHALQTLLQLTQKPAMQQMLRDIHGRIQGGAQLSMALEAHGDNFSRLYLNTVRAGEAGGALELVLQRLADYLERSAELRSTVVSALIYPAILFAIAVISIIALMVFVVPQFEPLFDDMGGALPFSTQLVFGMAGWIRDYGVGLLLVLVLVIWLWRRWLMDPDNRERWDAAMLRLPLLGPLLQKLEVGRFARTLATLLNNGVLLLTAVGIVREVLTNRALAAQIAKVEQALEQGRGMAQPLQDHAQFPPLAVQLIKVGEESGQLESMLLSVANVYDREAAIALKRTVTIIEPVLILTLGAMIATIILSILAAILGLNELVV